MTPLFKVDDKSYLDHPAMRGPLLTGSVTPSLLKDVWNTPHSISTYSKNDTVINAALSPLKLFVVTYGWFFSYSKLPNGQRQVHRIYLDGDIIGDDDFSRQRNSFNVESATDSRVASMDITASRALLKGHESLLGYLSCVLSHNLLLSLDHAKSISRLQTKDRLAHFLLSMLSRIRWAAAKPELMEIHIPLNQSVISDYLGLTNVHVSRTIKALENDGLIKRPGTNRYRIVNEDALIKMSGYVDRQKEFIADVKLAGQNLGA